MRSRIVLLAMFLISSLGVVSPAWAQTAPTVTWEGALAVHALRREDSSRTSGGGGVSVARWMGASRGLAVVLDATGTRRAGHNDWHLLFGGRAGLATGRRVGWFVQALAGTVVRQGHAGWSVQPGVGVDVRWAPRRALRLSIDAPVDSRSGNTQSGVQAGLALVWR